jgi:transcriptional accessory protein Tex/SPT6
VKLGDIVKVKVLEVSAARKPIAAQRFTTGRRRHADRPNRTTAAVHLRKRCTVP